MIGGFLKLHRSLLEWEWYKDTNTKVVFLHFLLTANIKDVKYMGFIIPRGSLVAKIESKKGQKSEMEMALGLTAGEIRGAINRLIKTGEITKKSTNKFTVINVVNFNVYQALEKETQRPTNDQPTDDERPIDDLLTNVEEELKEDKELKELKDIFVSPDGETPNEKFQRDSIEYLASKYLADKVLESNPNAKVPKDIKAMQAWCKHIDLLLRVDEKPVDEFRAVIKYAVTDSFWSTVILSTSSLRKKYDQLYAQMAKKGNKAPNKFDEQVEAMQKWSENYDEKGIFDTNSSNDSELGDGFSCRE